MTARTLNSSTHFALVSEELKAIAVFTEHCGHHVYPYHEAKAIRRGNSSTRMRPKSSLKRSANGRPPGPVWRYAVHFRQPGPGVCRCRPLSSNVRHRKHPTDDHRD